jgi:hypothetical protein
MTTSYQDQRRIDRLLRRPHRIEMFRKYALLAALILAFLLWYAAASRALI